MPRRTKFFLNTLLAVVAIVPVVLYAIVPGPGYTGAPGDNSTGCIKSGCHTGTPNSGPGSVKITASGGMTYVPGQTQQISVTITDSTEKKYGFQLTARVDSNPKTTEAGLLVRDSAGYTEVQCANGSSAPASGCTASTGGSLEWINHTVAGYNASNSTPGIFTYTFSWTPPATDSGTVTLYAAGEAVTGADVVTGTESYLTSLQLSPVAPPAITSVVSDASFASPVASGSWAAIFGSNLAPAGDSRLWGQSDIAGAELPVNLDGTSVTVNGKAATVEFISPGQVNVQFPDDTALGPVPVVVTTAGGGSASFTAMYAQFAPGLFAAAAPYLVAQHADSSYVTPASPAKPGEIVILWGTGFGPADPPVPSGQMFSGANALANPVTATVGGQPAPVLFAGVVGAGLVQINVQVPTGIGNGDAPVLLSVGGVSTQTAGNLISIQP